jgi:hypothetical protein
MLIGAAISFFTYKLVVSLISRFIRPLDADMMGLEAKSISVRFLEGEILDENSVREQVRDSSGWQPVTVAPSRKTVDLGPHEFRAKSVGWKLSSEGRGIISGGNYEGFSASSNSEPEIKLNLTTPWVFFVEKEALSDLENGATGALLYIRNSDTSAEKRVDDVEEFFYNFGVFKPSAVRPSSPRGDQDEGANPRQDSATSRAMFKFKGSSNKKQDPNQSQKPAEETIEDDTW